MRLGLQPYVGYLFLFLFSTQTSYAEMQVNITEELPYLDLALQGKVVRIQRIQDIDNRLTDDFSKTSRICPPFCLHPEVIAPNVETIGELELLEKMKASAEQRDTLILDARLPEFFTVEAIPTAINLPFYLIKKEASFASILNALGAKQDTAGEWNFEQAKTIILYSNGIWCDQAPQAIKSFLALGYPEQKLKYYRGGLQSWKQVGLTTSISETFAEQRTTP